MDVVSKLEDALGAELLRAQLLGAPPPRLADRYTIERFLGRGASGLVVAAADERLGRTVALKLAVGRVDASALAEARALARLDHPNVVRVFDVLTSDETYNGQRFWLWVVAMRWVPARSARAWLNERVRSVDEVVDVFLGAGAGLAAAHAESIVHRDFKLDNVLVQDDGTPTVIDFGFATTTPTLDGIPADATQEVAGTDPYLAPEAKRGLATRRSDQFAFALSMVEALTGRIALPGEVVPKSVSTGLWRALRRATHASADARYPSMELLLEDVRKHRLRAMRRSPFVLGGLALLAVGAAASRSPVHDEPFTSSEASVMAANCARVEGTWDFTTTVTTEGVGLTAGDRGLYRLEMQDEYCTLNGSLHRVSDAPAGAEFRRNVQPFTATIAGVGEASGELVHVITSANLVRVSDGVRGCQYEFDWLFDRDALRGSFIATCESGSYAGTLQGTRR